MFSHEIQWNSEHWRNSDGRQIQICRHKKWKIWVCPAVRVNEEIAIVRSFFV